MTLGPCAAAGGQPGVISPSRQAIRPPSAVHRRLLTAGAPAGWCRRRHAA